MVLNCNINQAIYILLEMPDRGHSVPCVCSTVRGVCIISFQGLVYCSQCTVAKGSKVGQQLAEHKTNTQWANSISPLPTPIYCGVDEVGAAEARKERSICAGSRHSANPAGLYLESLSFFVCLCRLWKFNIPLKSRFENSLLKCLLILMMQPVKWYSVQQNQSLLASPL